MNKDNTKEEQDADNIIDTYSELCKAYNSITAKLKEMFRQLPAHMRTYIEVDEAHEHSSSHDCFYSPLVCVSIFEAEGLFYLTFAKNLNPERYLRSKVDLEIYRTILEFTSPKYLSLDIIDRVFEVPYGPHSYEDALGIYNAGGMDYKPTTIEPTEEQALSEYLRNNDISDLPK